MLSDWPIVRRIAQQNVNSADIAIRRSGGRLENIYLRLLAITRRWISFVPS